MCDALTNLVCGLVMVIAAFPLIFWNELYAVRMAETIGIAKDNAVEQRSCEPLPHNEGQLVLVACELGGLSAFTNLALKEELKAQSLGVDGAVVDARPAVWFKEVVEIARYRRDSNGNRHLEWVDTAGSTEGRYKYVSNTRYAKNVKAGNGANSDKAFSIPPALLKDLSDYEYVYPHVNGATFLDAPKMPSDDNAPPSFLHPSPPLPDVAEGKLHSDRSIAVSFASLKRFHTRASTRAETQRHQDQDTILQSPSDESTYEPTSGWFGNNKYTLYASGYYLYASQGYTTYFTSSGDLRVSFTRNPATQATFLAKQQGNTFVKWDNPVYDNYDVMWAKEGKLTLDDFITARESSLAWMVFLFRVLLFALMWTGMVLVLTPFDDVMRFIPFLGPLAADLLRCVACIVSLPAALVLSLTAVALSWLLVRPVLAGCLLGGVGVCLALSVWMYYAAHSEKRRQSVDLGGGEGGAGGKEGLETSVQEPVKEEEEKKEE